jgi:uncharacterized protein
MSVRKIRIRAGSVEMTAELNDSPTAEMIWQTLPIEGQANCWGEEIYFSIPVRTGSEPAARQDVEVGELGYWPPGNAFCIFFGPTPVSSGSQPRAASPVNIIGRLAGNATQFRRVKDGERVYLERGE